MTQPIVPSVHFANRYSEKRNRQIRNANNQADEPQQRAKGKERKTHE